MNEKIFFTDLDGTLLNDKKEITPENQRAIDLALEKGNKIVITTGRPLVSGLIQAQRLGLTKENCYTIAFNGSQIYDNFNGRTVYGKKIPQKISCSVFKMALSKKIHIQTYSDTEVIAPAERPEIYDYVKRTLQTFKIIPDIADSLDWDPYKLLAIENERRDVIVQLQQEILKEYGDILDCYFSNDAYLEIVPRGISKGFALVWLCGFLNIPAENSVSAGDAPNDIDMIIAAHTGVAMANSFPGVKEQADYVTHSDNNHDGVAEIIHKFILEDE